MTARLLLILSVLVIHSSSGPVLALYANVSGDVLLGSFFPVHTYRTATRGVARSFSTDEVCGGIQDQDGIQPLEALMFSLDAINRDPSFLPGFRLGTLAFDSCDNEVHALHQASLFLKVMMIRQESEDFLFHCADGSTPRPSAAAADVAKIAGVIGGASSAVSIQLASVFRLFQMPQVSYLSTSPDLSNKERYPFFKRTVPSDVNQAKAIVEVLKAFNWTYVSAVVEDSNYGSKGIQGVEREAQLAGICLATKLIIDFDESWWGDDDYDEIVRELRKKPRAKAVILYAGKQQARKMFEAAKRMNASGDFVWIGSDAWSGRDSVVTDNDDVIHGAITVQPLAKEMPGFDDYFKSLKPHNNTRNPWFREYWEDHFNCNFSNSSRNTSSSLCTGNEQISYESGYRQQPHLHYIYDAVSAYAHALKRMHAEVCGIHHVGLCEGMDPGELKGLPLLLHLEEVNFTSVSGLPFSFVNISDGPPRYSILTYTDVPGSDVNQWQTVGQYSGFEHENRLSLSPDFVNKMSRYPASYCSEECVFGQAMKMIDGERCCWICVNCSDHEITVGTDICVDCGYGKRPNIFRNECIAIPEDFLRITSPWSIGCMSLAAVGVVLSLFVAIVFFVHRSTPVIKASGKELSAVLLSGIMLSFLSTFVFILKPHPITCATSRFLLGFCYTVLYASVLTKTNRISRIFNDSGNSPKKTRYTSPGSQLVIVTIIIFPEVAILIAWLVASRPIVINIYPTRLDNIIICKGLEDASYLIPLAYPLLLIFLCTVYAIKTRKTPDGFNETRLIAFTSYTTCVIWLAFIPLYFIGKHPDLRVTALCVSLSLNGAVALGCLFGPKVYICLLRPQKNTRDAVMARSSSVISSVPSSQNSRTEDPNKRHVLKSRSADYCRRCSVSIDDVTFSPCKTESTNVGFRASPEKNLNVLSLQDLDKIQEETTCKNGRDSPKVHQSFNNNRKRNSNEIVKLTNEVNVKTNGKTSDGISKPLPPHIDGVLKLKEGSERYV